MPTNYPPVSDDDNDWALHPIELDMYLSSWWVTDYWRYYFSIPLFISAIHIILMLTVANFESPAILKKNGEMEELKKVMSRIYEQDVVEARINQI